MLCTCWHKLTSLKSRGFQKRSFQPSFETLEARSQPDPMFIGASSTLAVLDLSPSASECTLAEAMPCPSERDTRSVQELDAASLVPYSSVAASAGDQGVSAALPVDMGDQVWANSFCTLVPLGFPGGT
jgi:hypothetical protein